jgi:uncharacterized protein (DUF1778 family)
LIQRQKGHIMTRKSIAITLRMTPEMHNLIQQAMMNTNHRSINEFIRTCIRAYLDDTGDIVGSRRHFSKRMGERLEYMESLILWHSLQVQMLTSRGMFTVLDELNPDAEQDPPHPVDQMKRASDASRQLLAQFMSEQDAIVKEIDAFRRKQKQAQTKQTPVKKPSRKTFDKRNQKPEA